MSINDRLKNIQDRIEKVKLSNGIYQKTEIIAVTKTHPLLTIKKCYDCGVRSIGENKVQEASEKFTPTLPTDLKKRFIGHLQTNKINKCINLFDTIDSVDTVKLAKKISKRSNLLKKTTPVLLEINTTNEPQKQGFSLKQTEEILKCFELTGLAVQGLMTVGPRGQNEKLTRKSFNQLKRLFIDINRQRPDGYKKLTELSMGMSGDYKIAVQEGSTQVRIGTALLGNRTKQ